MIIISLLFLNPSGIGPASALDSTPQSLLPERKVNSSGELDVELPPYVFPKDSDEDKPKRQGEELPPLVFPKQFGNENTANLSDKVTISNRQKITALTAKQSPSKKVASEVPDLLSDDTYNRTAYEDGAEGPVQSDTVLVTGPNVINSNKTHEEDVGKKENNTKTDSVTSVLPTSEANETTYNYQNVSPVHDTHSESTVTESNVKSTENFTYTANEAEAAKGGENFTSPGDVTDTFTNAPANDTNITMKDAKTIYVISEKSTEKNLKQNNDNKTIKDETVTKTKSAVSIQDETTIKPESSTAAKNETTATSGSSTAFEDETAAKTESNTTASDETSAKSESNTTIKDETAAETKSSSSIIDEISAIDTFTLPVQQSTTTTLKPTLKAESTTQINISENVIHNKADEDILVALAASQQHDDHSQASPGKSSAFLQPTESAAIFAGVFVGIALLGYVGLLVWRRVLE
jgi:hypothetical protein